MKRDIDGYDRISFNLLCGIPAQWLTDLRHYTTGYFGFIGLDIRTGSRIQKTASRARLQYLKHSQSDYPVSAGITIHNVVH